MCFSILEIFGFLVWVWGCFDFTRFCRFGVGVGAGVGVFFIFRTTSRIPPKR